MFRENHIHDCSKHPRYKGEYPTPLFLSGPIIDPWEQRSPHLRTLTQSAPPPVQCSSRWCPGHFLAENCWNVRQKWLVSTKPYGSSHMDHQCYPHSCSWLTFETHRPDAKGVVFLLDVSYFVYFVSSSVDDPNCVCLKMGSHTVIPSKLYIIWHNVTVIYPLVIKPGVLVTPHRTALPRVA
jgi:hypothetical protein